MVSHPDGPMVRPSRAPLAVSISRWAIVSVAAATLWFASQASVSAAMFANFDPQRHDRFLTGTTPNPAFFLSEGQIGGVSLNRATLITPRHYIAARHANTSAPIFRGGDGVVRTYSTSSSVTLTTTLPDNSTAPSDVMLFTLDAPIPVAHGVTPLALVSGSTSGLLGREFVVYGQDNQAGRNIIDAVQLVTFTGGASPTESIRYSFDTDANGGVGGLPQDEAALTAGDSGYPALLELDGELALIGAHYGINFPAGQTPTINDRYDSFSSLVTPYLDQIRAITEADGYSIRTLDVTAVPEPRHGVVPVVALVLLLAVCRRRQAGLNQTRQN